MPDTVHQVVSGSVCRSSGRERQSPQSRAAQHEPQAARKRETESERERGRETGLVAQQGAARHSKPQHGARKSAKLHTLLATAPGGSGQHLRLRVGCGRKQPNLPVTFNQRVVVRVSGLNPPTPHLPRGPSVRRNERTKSCTPPPTLFASHEPIARFTCRGGCDGHGADVIAHLERLAVIHLAALGEVIPTPVACRGGSRRVVVSGAAEHGATVFACARVASYLPGMRTCTHGHGRGSLHGCTHVGGGGRGRRV